LKKVRRFLIRAASALRGVLGLVLVWAAAAPALSAQGVAAGAALPGVWTVGAEADCAAGRAWVFFKEGHYAEVKLPSGPITSLGWWRDEGKVLVYTHGHMPFVKMAEGKPVRRMAFESRTSDRFETLAPSGTRLIFTRCPDSALKAPAQTDGH
jgi:hypothetical protein